MCEVERGKKEASGASKRSGGTSAWAARRSGSAPTRAAQSTERQGRMDRDRPLAPYKRMLSTAWLQRVPRPRCPYAPDLDARTPPT
eukprot:2581279-Pleurochrysis_carterae.AAC.1